MCTKKVAVFFSFLKQFKGIFGFVDIWRLGLVYLISHRLEDLKISLQHEVIKQNNIYFLMIAVFAI